MNQTLVEVMLGCNFEQIVVQPGSLPHSMRMIAGDVADSPFRQDAQYHQQKYAYHLAPFGTVQHRSADVQIVVQPGSLAARNYLNWQK